MEAGNEDRTNKRPPPSLCPEASRSIKRRLIVHDRKKDGSDRLIVHQKDTSAGTVNDHSHNSGALADQVVFGYGEDEHCHYTCEEADCIWPCDHHVHDERKPDFRTDMRDTILYADLDCSFCTLFKSISRSRCGCKVPDGEE